MTKVPHLWRVSSVVSSTRIPEATVARLPVYLRALNRSKVMEAVRDLSWGSVFLSLEREAHTGFEPVPPP